MKYLPLELCFISYMCYNFFQGQKKNEIIRSSLKKGKEKRYELRNFLSNKEMNYFKYKSSNTDNITCRINHRKWFVKKGVLKNFPHFTRKHLCWSVFVITFVKKVAKKRLHHRCLSVNFRNL